MAAFCILLLNWYAPFSLYGATTDVQVTHSMVIALPYMSLAFELSTTNRSV